MSTPPPAILAAGSIPLRRLKYVAPLSSARAEGNSRTDGYVGLEHVESWTGRLLSVPSAEGGDTEEAATGAVAAFGRGDVLFGKLRPYLAKAFLAEQDGVASTELLVLKPTPEMSSRYLLYLFLTPAFVGLVDSSTFGSKMPRSDWEFIGSVRVPVPRHGDQQRIANFLDTETARIDDLITEKEHVLARLEEKRAAIVTQAVTRGLDPKARRKTSGLEWTGEVPAHWRVMRLKHFTRIGNGSTPSVDNFDYWQGGEFPWLNSSVVGDRPVKEPSRLVTELALRECHLPVISPPAVLVAITGQGKTRGRSTVLEFEATINQHLAFVKPEPGAAECLYLSLLLDAAYTFLRSDSDGAGSTRGAITCEQLGNFRVPVPPIDEQQSILSHIDDSVRHFAEVEKATADSIALLRERRSAVITAAVTGAIPLEGMT